MKEIKITTDSRIYSVLVGKDILKESNFKEFSNRELKVTRDKIVNVDAALKTNATVERISRYLLLNDR